MVVEHEPTAGPACVVGRKPHHGHAHGPRAQPPPVARPGVRRFLTYPPAPSLKGGGASSALSSQLPAMSTPNGWRWEKRLLRAPPPFREGVGGRSAGRIRLVNRHRTLVPLARS